MSAEHQAICKVPYTPLDTVHSDSHDIPRRSGSALCYLRLPYPAARQDRIFSSHFDKYGSSKAGKDAAVCANW